MSCHKLVRNTEMNTPDMVRKSLAALAGALSGFAPSLTKKTKVVADFQKLRALAFASVGLALGLVSCAVLNGQSAWHGAAGHVGWLVSTAILLVVVAIAIACRSHMRQWARAYVGQGSGVNPVLVPADEMALVCAAWAVTLAAAAALGRLTSVLVITYTLGEPLVVLSLGALLGFGFWISCELAKAESPRGDEKRDAPMSAITAHGDDMLGDAERARGLADALYSHFPERSFTLGIAAGWGDGKSSFVRLMHEYVDPDTTDPRSGKAPMLKVDRGKRPLVVWFEPLQFGGNADLMRCFFLHVHRALVRTGRDVGLRDAWARLFMRMAGMVTKQSLTPVGAFAAELAERLDSILDAPDGSSASLRYLLDHDPAKQQLWIVVDDTDRVTPDQLLAFLGLLRVVEKIPRVRVLLPYSREDLVRQLSIALGGTPDSEKAEQYLEKFVNFEVSLAELRSDREWKESVLISGAPGMLRSSDDVVVKYAVNGLVQRSLADVERIVWLLTSVEVFRRDDKILLSGESVIIGSPRVFLRRYARRVVLLSYAMAKARLEAASRASRRPAFHARLGLRGANGGIYEAIDGIVDGIKEPECQRLVDLFVSDRPYTGVR